MAVPALQSLLRSGANDLPLGLSEVPDLVYWLSLAAGLVLLFGILCIVYWTVPNRLVPWRAIWPGAADDHGDRARGHRLPGYLNNISTIAQFGTTFVFVVIVLIWFYALALIILAGGILDAMRFELHEGRDQLRGGDPLVPPPSSALVMMRYAHSSMLGLRHPERREAPRCLIVDDHPVVRAGVRAVMKPPGRRPRWLTRPRSRTPP